MPYPSVTPSASWQSISTRMHTSKLPSCPLPCCAGSAALCLVPAPTSPAWIGSRGSRRPCLCGRNDEPDELLCCERWLWTLWPAEEPGGRRDEGGARCEAGEVRGVGGAVPLWWWWWGALLGEFSVMVAKLREGMVTWLLGGC